MTPEENKVIQLKYKSKQINKLSEVELLLNVKALLSKIHVITGWIIPNNQALLNILVDQFTKNLIEKFSQLNPDEIEYAFRQHGTTIEDWGKEINLNLLDKVLIKYIDDRFNLSQTEEIIKVPPLDQKIFTQEELDNSAREDVERQYQLFLRRIELKGLDGNKNILEYDKLLLVGESVFDFFKRKALGGSLNIYKKQ